MFQLNLKAPFFPARTINIGSVAGKIAESMGAYAYGLSKGALHQLTRMLALEFASRRIAVNATAPGRFPSEVTKSMLELASIPLNRWGLRMKSLAQRCFSLRELARTSPAQISAGRWRYADDWIGGVSSRLSILGTQNVRPAAEQGYGVNWDQSETPALVRQVCGAPQRRHSLLVAQRPHSAPPVRSTLSH